MQTADPAFAEHQEGGRASGPPVLAPDRRTIVFGFLHTRCEGLATVRATLEGRVAVVQAVIGTRPHAPSCSPDERTDWATARLPVPAPDGTTVRVG